jgi:hypothetical protein
MIGCVFKGPLCLRYCYNLVSLVFFVFLQACLPFEGSIAGRGGVNETLWTIFVG